MELNRGQKAVLWAMGGILAFISFIAGINSIYTDYSNQGRMDFVAFVFVILVPVAIPVALVFLGGGVSTIHSRRRANVLLWVIAILSSIISVGYGAFALGSGTNDYHGESTRV